METLIRTAEQASEAATGVDVFARWLAMAGLLLSALAIFLSRSDLRWQRRTAGLTDVREALRDVVRVLDSELQSSEVMRQLWSHRVSAALDILHDDAPAISDRRLRSHVTALVGHCRTARGDTRPNATQQYLGAQPGPSDPTAHRALADARSTAKLAQERLHSLRRRATA